MNYFFDAVISRGGPLESLMIVIFRDGNFEMPAYVNDWWAFSWRPLDHLHRQSVDVPTSVN
jgi:hypothetical protein